MMPTLATHLRLYQFHLCHHFRMFNPEDIEYLSTPAATLRLIVRRFPPTIRQARLVGEG
jgi:hypothetical protein